MQYLDNDAVYQLLINLNKDEAIEFRKIIEKTFEDFSISGERRYQPDPSAITRPNGQRTLFRPFTSDSSVGAKLIVEPPLRPDGKKDPLHGILILMNGQGHPTGILDAEEVTGYRTSMNAMVPFTWRTNVENIVIFGGGMQALWHTRLILTLRGSEVKTITFANPSQDRVDALIRTASRENEVRWKSDCSFHFINTSTLDSQEQIKTLLSATDCVFCTTPSRKPLFPASYLTERRTNGRLPLISAVGSWQSDMIELDPKLLHHIIATEGGYNPISGEDTGVVLVDDRDYALQNSGEVVQSKLKAKNMVELGQILGLMNRKIGVVNDQQIKQTQRFISQGFVVYKSIGVSLTDMTISNAILALAQNQQHHL
jgi:ornithine cyclodeaminase/alanine dehydrogenase-like protein (mu-crystallin family)